MDDASITVKERRALVIGINKYPRLLGRNLHGAVLDAQEYKALLEQRFGFASHEISLLLDEQATRDAILATIDGMVAWGTAGSHAVIIYCGHGRQIIDLDGDEEDGLDETLVPHDSGTGVDNRDIRDDELRSRIVALNERGVMVTTLFDSCHSGSATRDPTLLGVRGLPTDLVPGSAPARTANRAPQKPELRRDRIHIAACRDDQVAGEMQVVENGTIVRRGAFSYHLQRLLTSAPTTASWRSVFDRVFAEMLAAFPKQQPQSEGLLECAVLDSRVVKPGQVLSVEPAAVLQSSASQPSRSNSGFAVTLWRLPPRGDWLPLPGEESLPTIDPGDCLSLTVSNPTTASVYLQILRINCVGELELLYPRHAGEPLLSQRSVEFFRSPGERLQLLLPEEIAMEKNRLMLDESPLQETLQIVIEDEAGTRRVVTVPFLVRRPVSSTAGI